MYIGAHTPMGACGVLAELLARYSCMQTMLGHPYEAATISAPRVIRTVTEPLKYASPPKEMQLQLKLANQASQIPYLISRNCGLLIFTVAHGPHIENGQKFNIFFLRDGSRREEKVEKN